MLSHFLSKLSTFSDLTSVLLRLDSFLSVMLEKDRGNDDISVFEESLWSYLMEIGCAAMKEKMKKYDREDENLSIGGVEYKKAYASSRTFQTSFGKVRILRHLYSESADSPSVSPMERQLGLIKAWTPHAAKIAVWFTGHLPHRMVAKGLKMIGMMEPSGSSIQKLILDFGRNWEEHRLEHEEALRREIEIPTKAVLVAVSLDGVTVPMKTGKKKEKNRAQRKAGKKTSGPCGYKEASCATITFYDKEGKRLWTQKRARMPEPGKKTLKASLRADLKQIIEHRPDLKVVGLADGAKDNWTFLRSLSPLLEEDIIQTLDFYHACGHLYKVAEVAFPINEKKRMRWFHKYKIKLKSSPKKVIRAIRYRYKLHPNNESLRKELGYFRNNWKRMNYQEALAAKRPIGSGVVEAACKTLVSQRLKCSGMRWTILGGQAILTIRSLQQSQFFEKGWSLFIKPFQQKVERSNYDCKGEHMVA